MENQNSLSQIDLKQLEKAVELLETPSLTIQITNLIGTPAEWLINKLPDGIQKEISDFATTFLYKIINMAGGTMDDDFSKSSPWWHKAAVTTSGALGGFFGFSAILLELTVSTTIMMRSVLDIAREEGFSIKDPETKLACIEVFGFNGNKTDKDDNAESGYYITRAAFTEITNVTTTELTKIIAERTAQKVSSDTVRHFAQPAISTKEAGSILAKLIDNIAQRFGFVLTEKTAAQIVPVIGAVAAATLNIMFIDFYQDMAKGHFTVKRLEKKYGEEVIKQVYYEIMKKMVK